METSVDRSLRHWWFFVVRGILFILVGIYMIASPESSYVALGFIFGLIILVAGVAELFHATRPGESGSRRWHLFLGIVEVILGLVLTAHIETSVAILRIIVGIWFLVRGFSLFGFSRFMGRSWMLTVGGIIVIVFGLLIVFNPTFGDSTIILYTAIAFIINGVFNILLGYRLK